jgi:hypothetical protein
MTELNELIGDLDREIARLQQLNGVALRVDGFVGALRFDGLDVRAVFHGGRFEVIISLPQDAAAAVDPVQPEGIPDGDPLPKFLRPDFIGNPECHRDLVASGLAVSAAEPEIAPAAPVQPPGPVAAAPAALVKTTGAFTDLEKLAIAQMHSEGLQAKEIAGRLGWRVQTVALYLSRLLTEQRRKAVFPGAAAADPQVDDAPEPQPALQPEPAAAFVPVEPSANIDGSPPDGPLATHVAQLPRKFGWDVARDIRVLELAQLGWPVNEVAPEVGVAQDELKVRFDILTGRVRGEKPLFTRGDVLAELVRQRGPLA